jgi:heme-degrading monooxygenase HmoA
MISDTPKPPYYAVIFTSEPTENSEGYEETIDKMVTLASELDGYLGIETSGKQLGITVSYWKDLYSIREWKLRTEHVEAQKKGMRTWYKAYKTRICKVERDYGFETN